MHGVDEIIGPTPERLRMAGDDIEVFSPAEASHYRTIRLVDVTPIDRLRKHQDITADQYNAGCRYYSDWYKSGFAASGVIDPMRERVDCEGKHDLADAVLAAQTRFNHALKILDADAKHILDDVVLSEAPLRVYADRFREFRQYRERRAVALTLLRKALTQLANHYWPPRRDGIRSQGRPDMRPAIMPMEVDGG
jgi:hypothetical protein